MRLYVGKARFLGRRHACIEKQRGIVDVHFIRKLSHPLLNLFVDMNGNLSFSWELLCYEDATIGSDTTCRKRP